MTKTEQNKILEDKVRLNRLNFNLNRQSAIVSAFADGKEDMEPPMKKIWRDQILLIYSINYRLNHQLVRQY